MALVDLKKLAVGGGMRRSEAEYCRLLGQASFERIRVLPVKTHLSLKKGVSVEWMHAMQAEKV